MATPTPPGNLAGRRRKFISDNSVRVFPRSPSTRLGSATSHLQLKSASSRISSCSSSSSSSNASSVLSSAGSRRSNHSSLYRPASGAHYLNWFVPRYLVGSAGEDGCKPLLPAEGEESRAEEKNDGDNLKEREVPSPLHSSKKMAWLSAHTNDDLSSLPFPPRFHPTILDYPSPHADNLIQAFRRSWPPPVSYYCRHACPCTQHCWPPPPSLLPMPAAASGLPPPPSLFPLPTTGPLSLLPPPQLKPQGVFTNVGVAPRRHFTVHPDWRRIRHW